MNTDPILTFGVLNEQFQEPFKLPRIRDVQDTTVRVATIRITDDFYERKERLFYVGLFIYTLLST